MGKPYLTDSNRQRIYEGDRVWMYDTNEEPLNGTLKLTPIEHAYSKLYKWSVAWDDGNEYYLTPFVTIWKGENFPRTEGPPIEEPPHEI